MIITETKDGLVISEVTDFDATHIFECGQSFRWNKEEDGSYTGVAYGRAINVASDYDKGVVTIKNTNLKDFNELWFDYFDLGRDYGAIKAELSKDSVMDMAIKHGKGIRILRQQPWELVISYIISANNSIPRISKSLNILSELYGEPIEYNGRTYYAFPTIESLEKRSLEDIDICRAGFRCKYVYNTVKLLSTGEVNLDDIIKLPTDAARKELMRLPGVGPKVADCIMLFSMQKLDTYPIDVWIKRVTEHFFVGRDVTMKDIQAFAKQKFGDLAGIAQEYLFYYARINKIM